MEKIIRQFDTDIKSFNEEERTLTALVSTATKDRMGEVLLPEGVDLKSYQKNPVVLWAHDYTRPPIGRAMWTKKTKEGVMSKVQFAKTAFAEEVFQLFKDGFLKAFSVGFIPKEWNDGATEKEPRRTYNKWEMIEFSAVPVPANPDALSLAVRSGLALSDVLKKEMHIDDEPAKPAEPAEADKPADEPAAPEAEPAAPKVDNELIELLECSEAEVKQANEKIAALEKEISELRYAIYKTTQKQTKTPEITTDAALKLIDEAVSGAIRRATGKVN